jgi:hypothetical protein
VEKKRERNMKMADAILEFQKEARPKLHPSLVVVLAEREGGREWDILRYAEDRKKVVMIEINMRDLCRQWNSAPRNLSNKELHFFMPLLSQSIHD